MVSGKCFKTNDGSIKYGTDRAFSTDLTDQPSLAELSKKMSHFLLVYLVRLSLV